MKNNNLFFDTKPTSLLQAEVAGVFFTIYKHEKCDFYIVERTKNGKTTYLITRDMFNALFDF